MSETSAEGGRDPAVLRALLDQVEAARGPDREIDVAIARQFGMLGHAAGMSDEGLVGLVSPAKRYTASIDACVALLRHALPQSFWSVCDMENGPGAVIIRPMPNGYVGGGMYAEAATPPLAFLAALLKSLIAKAEAAHG